MPFLVSPSKIKEFVINDLMNRKTQYSPMHGPTEKGMFVMRKFAQETCARYHEYSQILKGCMSNFLVVVVPFNAYPFKNP